MHVLRYKLIFIMLLLNFLYYKWNEMDEFFLRVLYSDKLYIAKIYILIHCITFIDLLFSRKIR